MHPTRVVSRKLIGRLTKLCACGVLLIPFVVTAHAAERETSPPAVRPQPVPSVEVGILERYDLLTLQRVLFTAGHTNLSRNEKAELDQMAKTLSSHPTTIIELRGYADGAASPAANRALSLERATVIARFLTARGVARKRIFILGLGEVDLTGPPRLAKHQRVDVRVFAPPKVITETSRAVRTSAGIK